MNKSIKVVYMGTPDFAVPVLSSLNENYNVVLCVTRADKPKGRGGKMAESPIKEKAKSLGIPVITPEKVKTPEFTEELISYAPDFIVTCAYGKILPQSVLDVPKFGCVNVHASLLPKYRGAAPIWRVVLNGEKETGITTMMTDAGMDTGDILKISKIDITEDMTTGELHDALAPMGASLIIETIDDIVSGNCIRVKQNDEEATYAPTIEREDGLITWNESAANIHNKVRGCDPFPGAYTFIAGEKIKIWKTKLLTDKKSDKEPGTIINETKKDVCVVCGNGTMVKLLEVQTENSKRMTVEAFLNGHELTGRFD